ncbi:hypothetical protein CLAFUW4_07450 [Fulvia fulva]|uniref:Uncharacterized protein n=1 Tax=Passalora fulva TaxID=5499 RepID=A0A9Q8PA74_PASFU|nr:uncharacterized protein CLAFUR5_07580 [Fulvia fulva]KAK4621982.1 hypothetical protein CLAFUR4_07457 [Fulvia fulva]KAK4623318.1 hypothetical protein CLAFUR0_07456 [Fulvia fulva]UJO18733.1 hypothetical protein CLAFUR5_07580 [Fulvia fulva]WPV16521.1 hypothetical protein CLAFUW4_07450 [Fulvia fulva]WPV31702.1 hypothetical protein CLAFUW7_07453 [Fulvia fulva]
MAFMYLAGLGLVYFAIAQLNPRASRLARLRRASSWLFDSQLEPTRQTKRIAGWLEFVWLATFGISLGVGEPHGYADSTRAGWMFVYQSIGLGVTFLAAGILFAFWLRNLPPGQSFSQACCGHFDLATK